MDRVGLGITIIYFVKFFRIEDQKQELKTEVGYRLQNAVCSLLILVLIHRFFHMSTHNLLDRLQVLVTKELNKLPLLMLKSVTVY